jgi:hypothetical protein
LSALMNILPPIKQFSAMTFSQQDNPSAEPSRIIETRLVQTSSHPQLSASVNVGHLERIS